MTDVFISYSRKDINFANELVNALQKERRDVWIDWKNIPSGTQFLNEIFEGIENANTFIFVVSENSLTSEICNYELERAFLRNKRVIPIILKSIEGNTEKQVKGTWFDKEWQEIAATNWKKLSQINWIFATEEIPFHETYRNIIHAINVDIDHVKLHTKYLVRALGWTKSNENPSFLLTGDEIEIAESWVADAQLHNREPLATLLHNRFISESREFSNARAAQLSEMERKRRLATRFASMAYTSAANLHMTKVYLSSITTAISLLSHIIENEEIDSKIADQLTNVISPITRASGRLQQTIENLGTPFQHKLESEFRLSSAVQEAVDDLSYIAKSHDIEIIIHTPDIPVDIRAQYSNIVHIIRLFLERSLNAIRNIKATGGIIQISTISTGDQVVMNIENNGEPMSEEDQQLMFEIDDDFPEHNIGFSLFWATDYITNSGGHISVERIKDNNIFKIYLSNNLD